MLIGLAFLSVFGVLGWLYGHSWNNHVRSRDSVRLPAFFRWIFGKPGANGFYNIRAVYFQCLVFVYTGYLAAYNLALIPLKDALQALILTFMAIVGPSELIRYLRRR